MREFVIIVAFILVFFSGLLISHSGEETHQAPLTIEYMCSNSLDEYLDQECSFWERKSKECLREEIGTEGYNMCLSDLAMTEYNISNAFTK